MKIYNEKLYKMVAMLKQGLRKEIDKKMKLGFQFPKLVVDIGRIRHKNIKQTST